MPEVQQIIDGLGCFTTHRHPCDECPFNPRPGQVWVYGCIRGQGEIIEAAQEALRKAKALADLEGTE